jgi:hypothetical protein
MGLRVRAGRAGFARVKRTAIWSLGFAAAVAGVWACGALAYFPGWPFAARLGAALVFVAVSVFSIRSARGGVLGPASVVACASLVWIALRFVAPSNDRAWGPDQDRLPVVRREGEAVVVENVRNTVYRGESDFEVRWETRRYDLAAIRSVDFVVEPFGRWRGLAHVFLTFGFAGGEHLAVSVEIRKEHGETYSPLRGLYRNYEIMYVLADERDVIGLRANIRRNPVHLYPVRATPAQAQALFASVLARVQALEREPEFYHSIARTCATSVLRHVNELRADRIVADWRVSFPGYADALALELGLIDHEGDVDSARTRFLINGRSAFHEGDSGADWSARIRRSTTPARSDSS